MFFRTDAGEDTATSMAACRVGGGLSLDPLAGALASNKQQLIEQALRIEAKGRLRETKTRTIGWTLTGNRAALLCDSRQVTHTLGLQKR